MSADSAKQEPAEQRESETGRVKSARHSRWLKGVIPLVLAVCGVALVWFLASIKPRPERIEPEEHVAMVTVLRAEPSDVLAVVEARGIVQPAARVELSPHVAGPVVWMADELMPGGRLKRGQTLLRVDPSEFRLAVTAQSGQVSRAQLDLRREMNRQKVSARAWRLFRQERDSRRNTADTEPDTKMALNLPQVAVAEQALAAAESQLGQAELSLARTQIVVPFDALVESEQVDLGLRVTPGQPIVTLVGTERCWVQASVDVADVPLLRLPLGNGHAGSSARVSYTTEHGETLTRRGRVLRLQGDLDPDGSMARVLIQVDDPFALKPSTSGPPLLIGAFVDVAIEGQTLRGIYRLPERALRERRRVWLIGKDSRLQMREVQLRRRQAGYVLVESGLSPGDRVVVSNIDLPTRGMKLEVSKSIELPPAEVGPKYAPDSATGEAPRRAR